MQLFTFASGSNFLVLELLLFKEGFIVAGKYFLTFMCMISAGILSYRIRLNKPEVFLVHPGGPFWKNKDEGSWTIPKGEIQPGEKALTAALREFFEETGFELKGELIALTPVRQKAGKLIYAWAIHKDLDEKKFKSNMFEMEWPPKSGRISSFPEVDKAAWFDLATAAKKINPAQIDFLDQLAIINFK